MRAIVMLFALAFSTFAAAQPNARAGDRIVGEWRGTSICTNLALLPACRDETTRYVFTGPIRDNTYHIAADKLVGQTFEPMGEFDLTYYSADDTWSYDLSRPTCVGCKWWFRIDASGLIGGVTGQSGAPLRRVSARRQTP